MLAKSMFYYFAIMTILPFTFKLINIKYLRKLYLRKQILKPFSVIGYNQQQAN